MTPKCPAIGEPNMRTFQHWTPQYLFHRAVNIWYQKRHPDHPWLTPQAINILESWLTVDDFGIEWGSGRSTVWFAQRVNKLVSIENDPDWHLKINSVLMENGLLTKVDYRHIPIITSTSQTSRGTLSYADVACQFSDKSFDFALVDGKIRHICVKKVLPKLKTGGMLILDNSERHVPGDVKGTYFEKCRHEIENHEEWANLVHQLKTWRTIGTSNGVSKTRFWIKPV